MNANKVAFVEELLGRRMNSDELAYYEKFEGGNGFLFLDEKPREKRPIFLLYAACHGQLMKDYIQTYRADIAQKYYLVWVNVLSLVVRGLWAKEFEFPWIIAALFNHCEVMFYNPIGVDYGPYTDQNVLRYLNVGAKVLSYAGPHHGCWWVVCPVHGEQPVHACFDRGMSDADIYASIINGTFDPQFPKRFELQMAWLKGYQTGTDAGMADFIERNYRKCKLFFTYNHPSYNLIGYITDVLMGKLGYPMLGEDHAIALPSDRGLFADQFPETHYEWDFYKFEYPMRWQHGHGGIGWYKSVIADARQNWKKAG